MSLKIHSVVNASNPDEEFVRLSTSEKTNLKGYALVDRTFDADGKVSNEFRHIYVFPDMEVNPKEWVRLYTGKGKNSDGKNDNGHVVHFLYWGAKECVWNDEGGDTATLIKYTVADSKEVPAVPKK
jgi:hypothetical protein